MSWREGNAFGTSTRIWEMRLKILVSILGLGRVLVSAKSTVNLFTENTLGGYRPLYIFRASGRTYGEIIDEGILLLNSELSVSGIKGLDRVLRKNIFSPCVTVTFFRHASGDS